MNEKALPDKAFVVFDNETGGTNHHLNPILETAFVPVMFSRKDKVFVIDEELKFECLVKPTYMKPMKIEEKALEVNKLTRKEIFSRGNRANDVIDAIVGMAKALNPKNDEKLKPIFAGHNISEFDLRFLKKMFESQQRDLYSFFSEEVFDTLTLCRILFMNNHQIENIRLSTVCSYFGIKMGNTHTAMGDAYPNAQLLVKLTGALSVQRNRKLFLGL